MIEGDQDSKKEMIEIEEMIERDQDSKKEMIEIEEMKIENQIKTKQNLLNLKQNFTEKKNRLKKENFKEKKFLIKNNLFYKVFNSLQGCFFWTIILNRIRVCFR